MLLSSPQILYQLQMYRGVVREQQPVVFTKLSYFAMSVYIWAKLWLLIKIGLIPKSSAHLKPFHTEHGFLTGKIWKFIKADILDSCKCLHTPKEY